MSLEGEYLALLEGAWERQLEKSEVLKLNKLDFNPNGLIREFSHFLIPLLERYPIDADHL